MSVKLYFVFDIFLWFCLKIPDFELTNPNYSFLLLLMCLYKCTIKINKLNNHNKLIFTIRFKVIVLKMVAVISRLVLNNVKELTMLQAFLNTEFEMTIIFLHSRILISEIALAVQRILKDFNGDS